MNPQIYMYIVVATVVAFSFIVVGTYLVFKQRKQDNPNKRRDSAKEKVADTRKRRQLVGQSNVDDSEGEEIRRRRDEEDGHDDPAPSVSDKKPDQKKAD